MDQRKREQLEASGWQVGTATDFLNLTDEDLLLIKIKLALTRRLEERQQRSLKQETSIHTLGHSTQATKTENPEAFTSIDQLIRNMIASGASPQEIGYLIAGVSKT